MGGCYQAIYSQIQPLFQQILYWDMPREAVIKEYYFVLCTKQSLERARQKIACNAFGWFSVNRGLSQREGVFYSNSPGYQLPNIVQR